MCGVFFFKSICILNSWPFEASQDRASDFPGGVACRRLRLKCYGTCAEIRFRLSAKRTSPFNAPYSEVV